MADPVRRGVKGLIEVFHKAGVETVMITGDQSATAFAIAKKLDFSGEKPLGILDSMELTSIETDLMEALAKRVHVYSRVSPSHKLRIVQALQQAGKTVAMTGDGINDGPALKAADLGIAMGQTGTDVAREVADVVLEDDKLETLVYAVRDGRTTYRNIRKSVHFFLSTNLSEIMIMFAAMAAGLGIPLNVMQLLWINIISDIFPGLALAKEKAEFETLNQPPRDASAPIFSKSDFKRMMFESTVISGASLGAFGYGLFKYGVGMRAGSLAFQSLTIGQLLHALSCRSEHSTLFDKNRPPRNHYLSAAVFGSLAIQLLTFVVPGLRRFLGVSALNLSDAAVIAGSSVIPLLINEATKKTHQVE
jgi:Ca2+-transporting ATPase